MPFWEAPYRRDEAAPHDPYLRSIGIAFREVWRVPEVGLVILLSAATMSALMAGETIVQPYLIDRDVAVGPIFSLLQVPLTVLAALGALLAPRLLGDRSPLRLLVVIPLAGAALYGGLALLPGLAGFPLLLGGFALGAALEPITGGYLNRRIDPQRRATTLSILAMTSSIVLAMMVAGMGVAIDAGGIGWGFVVPAVVAAVAVALFAPPLIRASRRSAARPLAEAGA